MDDFCFRKHKKEENKNPGGIVVKNGNGRALATKALSGGGSRGGGDDGDGCDSPTRGGVPTH